MTWILGWTSLARAGSLLTFLCQRRPYDYRPGTIALSFSKPTIEAKLCIIRQSKPSPVRHVFDRPNTQLSPSERMIRLAHGPLRTSRLTRIQSCFRCAKGAGVTILGQFEIPVTPAEKTPNYGWCGKIDDNTLSTPPSDFTTKTFTAPHRWEDPNKAGGLKAYAMSAVEF
ncbi:hypothetical protein BDP55DRAFT_185075 [Colletotrichum godetiae]|uniref:Uncharacterized protein n=1 Tax=Colletotrichum godetiae TaxID=1209918 RepID=A0AAJ0EWN9_9PEZI|nr:uncharacterized protein BDP55DRAFT_185075 [Colletotrichum godetiae]KAK1674409.1 hypothetical protein BDP55DRAFT_185075 [Colletotrichum godetiae]